MKIVAVFPYRDFILAITEDGRVYKMYWHEERQELWCQKLLHRIEIPPI